MSFYTIVDAPFPAGVFKSSEGNIFVTGLFIWLAEKLESILSERYGNVKTEVIYISKFGSYDYHIVLLFLDESFKPEKDFVDKIYWEADREMEQIISAASLSNYLDYYDTQSKISAINIKNIVKTEGD